MALDFPASPSNGQQYTSNGITYQYNGEKWQQLIGLTQSITEFTANVSSSSGSLTLDLSAATMFVLNLSENITSVTVSNVPSNASGTGFMIKTIQDTTARTITWPASFEYPGGSAPTLSSGAGNVDVYAAYTFDAGNVWYLTTSGQNFS
jgi:hypothetical protein